MIDMCEIDRDGHCIQCGRFVGCDEEMRRECFEAQTKPTPSLVTDGAGS